MDLQNTISAVAQAQPSAPPAAQPDGRAVADTAAVAQDKTPEVPMPVAASAAQSGLVSKAALPNSDASEKSETPGVSAAHRTLKPYGINMLPEKHDMPKQTPSEPAAD